MQTYADEMAKLEDMKAAGGHITDSAEFLIRAMSFMGHHAHSDHDIEMDGDPWDEYNKVDRATSLEVKLQKKLN